MHQCQGLLGRLLVLVCMVSLSVLGLPNAPLFSDSQIAAALSQSRDWQADGQVTRVKNQGKCGSCWVFATVATLETTNAVSGNMQLTSLSEQFVLDCVATGKAGMDGCTGGLPATLLTKLDSSSIPFPMERDYEYYSYNLSNQLCQDTIPRTDISVKNAFQLAVGAGQKIEDVMAAYVYYNSSITVSVKAYSDLWDNYDSGVLLCPATTSQQLDHAVTIVGYGVDSGVPYWKIKNSWTPRWGEGGYIRLQRGNNTCGVAYSPVIVTM